MVIFFVWLLAVSLPASAQASYASFDNDTEGWWGDLAVVSWGSTGGNPGGFLQAQDQYLFPERDFNWYRIWPTYGWSPEVWSRSWYLSADIKNLGSTSFSPVFLITAGSTAYEYTFGPLDSGSWQRYELPLTGGWKWQQGSNSFEWVLQNNPSFRIKLLFDGPTIVPRPAGFDNIKLGPSSQGRISTFDTNEEGWSTMGAYIIWHPTAGNPGGFIEFRHFDWHAYVLEAPGKFLGRWQKTGTISADVKFLGTQPLGYDISFKVNRDSTTYLYPFYIRQPITTWTTLSASLADDLNWICSGGTLSLRQVLENVTSFQIDLVLSPIDPNWDTTQDALLLDNIKVRPAALPGVGLLLLGD